MTDWIIELVLDESKWLSAAMLTSVSTVAVLFARRPRQGLARRLEVFWVMNLFFGCMLGVMAFGHLLAVTVKAFQGTLVGPVTYLYGLGLVLAVPSWWLALSIGRLVRDEERGRKRIVTLNACLGVGLLALGLHNWPLALPAILNIAYAFHTRRLVGWTIVTVTIAANLLLFVGSLFFLASGQSFEQFKDM